MKRNRLWIAAPILALSLFAVPTNEADAAEQTVTQSEALFVDITHDERALFSDTVVTEEVAIQQIAADLQANKASTTFTITYEKNDDITSRLDSLFKEAQGLNEYVYGSGAGYGLSASKNETKLTLHVTFYYNYHLLNSDFDSFYETTIVENKDGEEVEVLKFNQEKHEKEVALVQQREQEVTNYVKKTASKLFNDDMTEFEKVKAAYDYVILNTTYGATTTPGYGAGHSAYSIVKEGVGVCQAYALLFQRLMEEAGVESKYVTGERIVPGYKNSTEGHAWNVVTIDGKTYHIDTTHGDPVGDHLSKEYISYQTFLLTEEQIKEHGHIITEKRPYVKPKTSNYSVWHIISESKQIGDILYYLTDGDESNILKKALITKNGEIQPQSMPEQIEAYYFTKFNNKVYFTEFMGYRTQLKIINENGVIESVKEGFNEGYDEGTNVWAIEIKNNELLVYEYDSTNIVYREKLEKPIEPEKPVETDKPTEAEVIEEFSKITTIERIENTKKAAEFAQLIEEFKWYINSDVKNDKLNELKRKVEGYEEVKKALATKKMWEKTLPKVGDPTKSWTIEFTLVLHGSDKDKLYVTDIFGEPLDVEIQITGEFVTIKPLEEYQKGAEYYLVIPEDIKSVEGIKIEQAVSLSFTLE